MFYILEHNKINIHKWDLAIANSHCANIFQFYWYLNLVTNNQWMALIEDDYKTVLPLPFVRKFKKHIIYHNNLLPFLAICGNTFINEIKSTQIFELIHKNFIKANFILYKFVDMPADNKLKIKKHQYFSKDLIYNYDKNLNSYTNFAHHLIAQSKRDGYYFNNLIKIKGIVKFLISENYSHDLIKIETLKNILLIAQDKNLLFIDAIYDKSSSLAGLAVYLIYQKSATLLILHTKSSLPGKVKSMIKLALIDHFINLNSQKNIKLDIYPWMINETDSMFLEFMDFSKYHLLGIEYNRKFHIFKSLL